MTKEQFVEEIKAEKARYMVAIEAYFDALIEHDFEKACKTATQAICVLKPNVQAYMAEQMYELSSYEELEETYRNVVDDVLNELDEQKTKEELAKEQSIDLMKKCKKIELKALKNNESN